MVGNPRLPRHDRRTGRYAPAVELRAARRRMAAVYRLEVPVLRLWLDWVHARGVYASSEFDTLADGSSRVRRGD